MENTVNNATPLSEIAEPKTEQKEVQFVVKTEVKKDEVEICYYTTEDDMYVPDSLSFNKDEAERFYLNYVEKQGNLVEIKTLSSATIQKKIS